MLIKPDRIRICQIPIIIILEAVVLLINMDLLWIFIVLDLLIILDGLVTWKTLSFDNQGCVIKLFCYQRRHRWEEIIVRRKEKYNFRSKFIPNHPRAEGMFFSIVPVNKPCYMDPLLYCVLRHPFRCFFVYLADEKTICDIKKGKWNRHTSNRIYIVDKKTFLGKLRNWGISYTE